MLDEIYAIEGTSRPKKKKNPWAHYEALANAVTPTFWNGALLPTDQQIKFLSLIHTSATRVSACTLENNRRNHEEKREWSQEDKKRDYFHRIRKKIILDMNIENIHSTRYTWLSR